MFRLTALERSPIPFSNKDLGMISHPTMPLLAAAWLLAATPQGFAQDDAPPMPASHAAGSTPSSTHRPTKPRTKHIATHQPAAKSLPMGGEQIDPAAERAASLERRRKAFFANKPDDGQPAGDGSSAPVGVTLGGSGGLTPEMGLKF